MSDTPRTEAGKRLLEGFAPEPAADAQELHRRSTQGRRDKLIPAILAIEDEARALPDPTEPRESCWFCKGSFPIGALIAGYDTFEEQRLACLACNERMSGNWHGATPDPAAPEAPEGESQFQHMGFTVTADPTTPDREAGIAAIAAALDDYDPDRLAWSDHGADAAALYDAGLRSGALPPAIDARLEAEVAHWKAVAMGTTETGERRINERAALSSEPPAPVPDDSAGVVGNATHVRFTTRAGGEGGTA